MQSGFYKSPHLSLTSSKSEKLKIEVYLFDENYFTIVFLYLQSVDFAALYHLNYIKDRGSFIPKKIYLPTILFRHWFDTLFVVLLSMLKIYVGWLFQIKKEKRVESAWCLLSIISFTSFNIRNLKLVLNYLKSYVYSESSSATTTAAVPNV